MIDLFGKKKKKAQVNEILTELREHYKKEDYLALIDDYNRIVGIDPDCKFVYHGDLFVIGTALMKLEEYENAIKVLVKAYSNQVQEGFENAAILYNLAYSFAQIEKLEFAFVLSRRAFMQMPEDEDIKELFGILTEKLKEENINPDEIGDDVQFWSGYLSINGKAYVPFVS
jgi:tetratricopeptide (TPR) repeat protein